MNNTPSTLDRTSSVRTSRPSKPYEPPKAGPAYNARLGQDIHKRFRGNPRLQIAMFCKHLDWGRFEEPDSPFERRRRFQMGEVLQLCVTQLASSRIRLQNLADLSQKHVLLLVRQWQKRCDPVGLIRFRIAMIRRCFSLLKKHAPLLATLDLQRAVDSEGA